MSVVVGETPLHGCLHIELEVWETRTQLYLEMLASTGTPFASPVGALLTGTGRLRPGLIFAVTSLARSGASPTRRHVAIYMRLFATASLVIAVSGIQDTRAAAIKKTDGPQS